MPVNSPAALLTFDLKLDSTEKPYPVSMSFSIKGLIAREIPALKNSRLPLEGSVDVDIKVESKGVSAKEIAANANGEMKGSGLNTYFPATGMDIPDPVDSCPNPWRGGSEEKK